MTVVIRTSDIRRHGRTIILGQGRTATEGDNGLPTLRIRQDGKTIKCMRGSSLQFANPLSDEDRNYLAALGSD